jgi:hypothetical protein
MSELFEKKTINRQKLIFVTWCLTTPVSAWVFISQLGAIKGSVATLIFSIPIALLTILLLIIWAATWGIIYGMVILFFWEMGLGIYTGIKPIARSLWSWLHQDGWRNK